MRTFSGVLLMIAAATLGVLGDPGAVASSLLFVMACIGLLVVVDDL